MQPGNPFISNEFAVAGERRQLLIGKRAQKALHQVDALSGARTARLVQNGPQQRHADLVHGHREHEDVQISPAKLPVRAVHRQMPGLAAQTQNRHGQAGHLDRVQTNLAEEPLKPPMHRGGLRGALDMRRQTVQVHRAGPGNPGHQLGHRLAP